jgi:glycosyltransferase involved in cell wall biosynthesis
MKKILFCVEFYSPNIGGAEKHVQLLAEYFNKNNCKAEIATTYTQKRKSKINGIQINQFKIQGNSVRGYAGDTIKYQDFLINSNYDVIVFYAAQQWSFDLSLEVIEKIKAKTILIPCGFSKLSNLFYKPYFAILKKKINNFDKIICLSFTYQDYLFSKKYFKKKVSVIYNGADDQFYRKVGFRKKYEIKQDEIFILYLSNIKFMKGQDRFIKIISSIKNIKINAFIIYANNPNKFYLNYLKHKIKKINMFNKNIKINILKNVSNNFKYSAFSECDYFINTSRIECSPLVMFEAMAAGKLYLGSNVGNCKEIQTKLKYGFISNDDNQISDKLEKFIISKQHKKKMIQKKIYNYFKKNHDWEILLKKYKKLITTS